MDQLINSTLPSGVTQGNAEISNTYDFDGTSSAALAVDGSVVNDLLTSNTTLVLSTWIQIRASATSYIYCMGRVFSNYRHFCIFYRGVGFIDLQYQRQYQPDILDGEEPPREISQSVRVAFQPAPNSGASLTDGSWHFYQLQLVYRPDGNITLEMFIDGIPMQAFVVRYRANGNTIEVPIPDPNIIILPFRPEPVSAEDTGDMIAFMGARYNRPGFNLDGRLGRMLIFPYLVDPATLNCYTSCNELLFINGPILSAITATYDGVKRALNFNGAAALNDYITLLRGIAFSTSNPISGTNRYVRLNVS